MALISFFLSYFFAAYFSPTASSFPIPCAFHVIWRLLRGTTLLDPKHLYIFLSWAIFAIFCCFWRYSLLRHLQDTPLYCLESTIYFIFLEHFSKNINTATSFLPKTTWNRSVLYSLLWLYEQLSLFSHPFLFSKEIYPILFKIPTTERMYILAKWDPI